MNKFKNGPKISLFHSIAKRIEISNLWNSGELKSAILWISRRIQIVELWERTVSLLPLELEGDHLESERDDYEEDERQRWSVPITGVPSL